MKANLKSTWNVLTSHFPTTKILPTVGNNDGRFHDNAIDEEDKEDYYAFLYSLWFESFAGNQSLDLDSIKTTLSAAGNYRADISQELTVLQINSMYMTTDDTTLHGDEA